MQLDTNGVKMDQIDTSRFGFHYILVDLITHTIYSTHN